MIDARDQGALPLQTNEDELRFKKKPVGVGILGIFGFYSLPIRRAAFSDFIQAKGRLIRPSPSPAHIAHCGLRIAGCGYRGRREKLTKLAKLNNNASLACPLRHWA
jgi:hypothetical protein